MLRFIYVDAKGQSSERVLNLWTETAEHIQGRCEQDQFPRTFRKDRIQQFLAGAELLNKEIAPPLPRPAPKLEPGARPQILFTGFKADQRQLLESTANEQGMRVMKTAGKSLTYLCIGANAGPTKVDKAREAGAFILNELELKALFETGELPY
ncbi:BRCT domain-containing protein [Stutzerimonas sp.]|uniref:BRCT domain-containing protein n=1 Tax=Stutzerimonas sp. TaxID=2901166 RepID=UPI0035B2C24D